VRRDRFLRLNGAADAVDTCDRGSRLDDVVALDGGPPGPSRVSVMRISPE
jgi:hypothetical protein